MMYDKRFLICDILYTIQGVPKRMRLGFCLISQQPCFRFSHRFFSWKLRSIRKFWIQNHFCAILGNRDIYKTKCDSETDQFIFILSHSGLKTTNFVPGSANWPKMDPDSSQVVISGPSNPNWLNRCYNRLYLYRFQNMWEL